MRACSVSRRRPSSAVFALSRLCKPEVTGSNPVRSIPRKPFRHQRLRGSRRRPLRVRRPKTRLNAQIPCIEPLTDVLVVALLEVPVRALDHAHRGAEVLRDLPEAEAGGEPVRRGGVPQPVGAAASMPAASSAGAQWRLRQLPRWIGPLSEAGNTMLVSSLGGTPRSASTARSESGTARRDPRLARTSLAIDDGALDADHPSAEIDIAPLEAIHSDGRSPVSATNTRRAPCNGDSSAAMRSISSSVNGSTSSTSGSGFGLVRSGRPPQSR
jgi:hypothetical protein